MLGKLFKHEMKATSALFLPLLLGFIAVTLLCKISFESNVAFFSQSSLANIITTIFFILYFIYTVGLIAVTFVFIVTRFYKSMVGDQGYLTNTLPVKAKTLVHAKLISSFLWEVIVIILLLLSFCIFLIGHISITDIQNLSNEFYYNFGDYMIYMRLPVILFLFTLIISLFYAPLMLYASIALGHLFGKHRILLSVVAYFILYTIIQIIQGIFTFIFSFNYLIDNTLSDSVETIAGMLQNTLMIEAIITIVFSVIFYIITCFVFQKKLNLE